MSPDDIYTLLCELLRESDECRERAIEWAQTASEAELGDDIVERIVTRYIAAPEFDTWVDDVNSGDAPWPDLRSVA